MAKPISYELKWMIRPSLGAIVSGVALQTDRFLIADLPAHLRPQFSLAGSPEEATQLRTYKNPDVFPNSCFTPAALFNSMSSSNKLKKYTIITYLSICHNSEVVSIRSFALEVERLSFGAVLSRRSKVRFLSCPLLKEKEELLIVRIQSS